VTVAVADVDDSGWRGVFDVAVKAGLLVGMVEYADAGTGRRILQLLSTATTATRAMAFNSPIAVGAFWECTVFVEDILLWYVAKLFIRSKK